MKRPLRYVYLYQDQTEYVRYVSGVYFAEFMEVHPATNLVLVKHEYHSHSRHKSTGFVIVEPSEVPNLIRDNPEDYGDFHLLDAPDLGALEHLTKQDIAEILYLSHTYQPFSSPFFPRLGNSFAYLAHDDGWFTKTFFRDGDWFYTIYGDILKKRIEQIHRRRLPPYPAPIRSAFHEWARQGLYIDLKDVTKSREEFTLTVHLVGAERAPYSPSGRDIDDISNDEEQWKRTSKRGLLRCYKRQWFAEW